MLPEVKGFVNLIFDRSVIFLKKFAEGALPALRCGECGGEITRGESYWQINGGVICTACLGTFAKSELEPFRRVWGKGAVR